MILPNNLSQYTSPLREKITTYWSKEEPLCIEQLLQMTTMTPEQIKRVQKTAYHLVSRVRSKRAHSGGFDAFMQQYDLSSEEGIALMCLAEVLLRIPDKENIDHVIRDKIAHSDWKKFQGQSESLFVNAATWGLMVTGKLLSDNKTHPQALSSQLRKMLERAGEPFIRQSIRSAMKLLGSHFVTGQSIEEAMQRAEVKEAQGYRYSYDMLGEAARTDEDALAYFDAYKAAIIAIGEGSQQHGLIDGPGISVKLSALHSRYEVAQYETVMDVLYQRLRALLCLAKTHNIALNIDAEEADRLELSLDLIEKLSTDSAFEGWHGLGVVIQAYQKRCPYVIDWLIDLGKRTQRRFMVRLVKGAYWDSEIKHAQELGLDGYPVYTRKVYTDLSYLASAKKMLAAPDVIYPQFATHNAYTLSAILELAPKDHPFEFQCLHGMGESLYDEVTSPEQYNIPCRIYAPVGHHKHLLAYLVRRLLENGANSSFVNQILNDAIPTEHLIEDPIEQTALQKGQPNKHIPLPRHLYGTQRLNALGFNLSHQTVLEALHKHLREASKSHYHAHPLIAGKSVFNGATKSVFNPANLEHVVGEMTEATEDEVEHALTQATLAQSTWHNTSIKERAQRLRTAADLIEENIHCFLYLAIAEAGKTLGNAIAEAREAIDFCRYYAEQAESHLTEDCAPLGNVVCISPWNFPLAIFLGEVTASLVAGNTVLAKPAELTPLIAFEAIKLLHLAGIPEAVVQFIPGPGRRIGAQLAADPRTSGVIFTGSTGTAKSIQKTLAKRGEPITLIAETGGQNAMIVDSTALPEQVVNDVITSAFDSAGQRCSALRVLCLQEEIADDIIHMLKGAMKELHLGDPNHLHTDVGPVIDQRAQNSLQEHIDNMHKTARLVYQVPPNPAIEKGTFIPPVAFEIDHISCLENEVFGPVLHIVRYQRPELQRLIEDINATGFGLTLGIHSRIQGTVDEIIANTNVGNTYVNRNQVGAIVGVQPFGGEGLSGTGPKAGGPFYLQRLIKSHAPKENDIEAVYQNAQRLTKTITLPGPTGEKNELFMRPRGHWLIMLQHGQEHHVIRALHLCKATGNTATLLHEDPLSTDFQKELTPFQTLCVTRCANTAAQLKATETEAISGVLYCSDHTQSIQSYLNALAMRPEELLPLILVNSTHTPPLDRFYHEKTVSTDTTAAGGNTSLMTLNN